MNSNCIHVISAQSRADHVNANFDVWPALTELSITDRKLAGSARLDFGHAGIVPGLKGLPSG
jgi:hypothetical protein